MGGLDRCTWRESVLGFVAAAAEGAFQRSPKSAFPFLRAARRRRRPRVLARFTGSDLLKLRRLDVAGELPLGFHVRDAHEKNHIGRRLAGGSGCIYRKRKRRHDDLIDRNRNGGRRWDFVILRRSVGMKLVGVRQPANLNRGRRIVDFGGGSRQCR